MILLYASPHEVKYVTYEPKYNIGVGAKLLEQSWLLQKTIKYSNHVILFGSSGLTMKYDCCITDWDRNKVPLDEFIIPRTWNGIKVDGKCCAGYTSKRTVKEQWEREWLAKKRVMVVDQESAVVAKLCQKLGVKFTSVRYIIDRCDKRVMPMGINWAWRKYQHRRMQLKFNDWLEGKLWVDNPSLFY